MMHVRDMVICSVLGLCAAVHGRADISIASLTPSATAPQTVGVPIVFTVSASDPDAGALEYRFRVAPSGGSFRVVIDYSVANTFTWAATEAEGTYDIEASVRNRSTGSTATSSVAYSISSRVTANQPVVSATSHPLVALYSAPPCPAGAIVRVRFKRRTDSFWSSTDTKPCNGLTSVNFYVAGMYPSTTYQLRQEVIAGRRITSGPGLAFTTGASGLADFTSTVAAPPPSTSFGQGILLHSVLGGNLQVATDLNRHVIWYYAEPVSYLTRPVPGGTFLAIFGMTTDLDHSGIRELDLAGNTVRETNVARMNEQLAALGMNTISTFHHECRKLPNGHYLTLGMTERRSTAQGGTDRDIASDIVLELDSDFQLLWAWDAFDHLDVTRPAVLNETCKQGQGGCVLLHLNGDADANDWTHTNCVALAPDGNIIVSIRHQDAVLKIAFENGSGDGHIIWRLGKDGDFAITGGDAEFPWFSHQHDVEYEAADAISLFDNGNTRSVRGFGAESRGQVLTIDEARRTATATLNAHLGSFSGALGAAQRLINGNYAFTSGLAENGTEITETDPAGVVVYRLTTPGILTYRSFRLTDMYSAVSRTVIRRHSD